MEETIEQAAEHYSRKLLQTGERLLRHLEAAATSGDLEKVEAHSKAIQRINCVATQIISNL